LPAHFGPAPSSLPRPPRHRCAHAAMPASLTGLHVQRCLHEPLSRGRAGFSLSPAAGTLAPARAATALASPAPYKAAATCYGVFFSLVLD